jgi:hypothetical protein
MGVSADPMEVVRVNTDRRRCRQNGFWIVAKSPVYLLTTTLGQAELRESTGL